MTKKCMKCQNNVKEKIPFHWDLIKNQHYAKYYCVLLSTLGLQRGGKFSINYLKLSMGTLAWDLGGFSINKNSQKA